MSDPQAVSGRAEASEAPESSRRGTAVVTGGASGIGRATADLLLGKGVAVAILDMNSSPSVDVADASSVGPAIAAVRAEFGPIDIVVNAAGVACGGRVDEEDYEASWDRALDINLRGAMNVVRACIDDLVQSGHGRIVNVASILGLGAARGSGPYSVSKHGLVGFTRSLAVDFGRLGVTANCVCPGATLTGMTGRIPAGDRDAFARRHIPVGRYAAPEEIAYMIVALTDGAATFVNGAVISVDGGQMAMAN
jgi:3-oxoacyl-[acyl-carrier protein] reductase